jgi:hypothetical protein
MAIDRTTLPSFYQDQLSSRVLLPPEPAYVFAQMLFDSVAQAEMQRPAGAVGPNAQRQFAGIGQPVPGFESSVDPNGGRNFTALTDAIATDFFDAARPGQSVMVNRMVFADTTYTEASRRVTRATIGSTNVDLTGEQVSLTIHRYAGPLTGAGGSVGPHVIEEFDLDRENHSVVQRVGTALQRDRVKFVDYVIGDLLVNGAGSSARVYAGDPNFALSADASAFLAAGDRPMDPEMIFRAEEYAAQTLKMSPFGNGRWAAFITPRQERQLKTSSRFEKMVKNFPEKNPIFSQYLGTLGRTDLFVTQTAPTTTANSLTVQLGVLMGPGAIGYALAKAPNVYADDSTNYGQRVSVIWRADEAFGMLDNRKLVSLRSD